LTSNVHTGQNAGSIPSDRSQGQALVKPMTPLKEMGQVYVNRTCRCRMAVTWKSIAL